MEQPWTAPLAVWMGRGTVLEGSWPLKQLATVWMATSGTMYILPIISFGSASFSATTRSLKRQMSDHGLSVPNSIYGSVYPLTNPPSQ